MAWVFKIENLSDIRPILNGEGKWVFELTQKPNFGGNTGDDVLLLVPNEEDWIFMYSCEILEVNGREPLPDLDEKRKMLITLGKFKALAPPNRLKDYSYTLIKIHDFEEPITHFRRRYGYITQEEFDAIIKGQIFISRTVFGKLINSLHLDHRLNFFKALVNEKPELYFNPEEYIEAYRFLKSYLENNLFQHVQWLTQTHRMLSELVDESVVNEIGFLEPSELERMIRTQKVEKISTQVSILEANQVLQDEQGLLVELENEIRQSAENEKYFDKLFRFRPLPIQFNS